MLVTRDSDLRQPRCCHHATPFAARRSWLSDGLFRPKDLRLDRHATRNFDALAVDPSIVLAKQGRDHRADIVGQAGPAQRRQIGNMLVDLRIVANHAAAEIGRDGAWRNDVDGDPARPEFFRHVLGEHFDSCLHRSVRGAARHDDAGEAC